MAEDIVERLRSYELPDMAFHTGEKLAALLKEAADAISMLRSELKITEDMAKLVDTDPSFREIKNRAKLATHG